jgi:hypothetical protein
MDIQHDIKKKYIKKISKQANQLDRRFQTIKKDFSSRHKNNKEETDKKFKKLYNCLDKLKWRLENFANNNVPLDELVEKSFNDMLAEIDWRMSECELALEGKQIYAENEKKRIAKNYARKKK